MDAQLRVGQLSESVTITAEAPLVDTRSGALSGLVDDRRVVDLPLNGRNVISLASTLPGIVSSQRATAAHGCLQRPHHERQRQPG